MAPDNTSEAPSSTVLFLKGRFKSSLSNLYGLFLIEFSPDGKIASHNFVVSTFSTLFNLEPHESWTKYQELILGMRWKGNCNASVTAALSAQMTKLQQDEMLTRQLYGGVADYDYKSAENFIFDILYRMVQDKNVVLETGIEEITTQELAELKKQQPEQPEEQTDPAPDSNLGTGAFVIPVGPILAPVKGRPLYELKIGDKMMIRIMPSSERANAYIEKNKLRSENYIKPIPATVIDIKAENKNSPVEILTKIDENLYGKIVEEERQVKLRMYDPQTDGAFTKTGTSAAPKAAASGTKAVPQQGERKGFSNIIYLAFGVVAIIILSLILLLYINI